MPQPSDSSGVLLRLEQLEAGADPGPQVGPELFLAFVQALVQNTHNGDLLHLALAQAKRASGASDEEVQRLVQAIRNERPLCNRHPDFYGEF